MEKEAISEDEILMHIGVLLMNVQQFEFLLSQAIKQTFADREELTKEKILAEDKRTLGTLLRELKKRTEIESDAANLLSKVLQDRNLFVHNLIHQEWFDTATLEGRDRVLAFLMPFTEQLDKSIRLFIAIHMKHGDEIGFESEDTKRIKKERGWELDQFLPHAHKIRKKDNQAQ